MVDAIGKTRDKLIAAHDIAARVQRVIGIYRLALRATALLILAMAVDILWPFENALRGCIVTALLLWTISQAHRLKATGNRGDASLQRAARLVEDHHPELDNALINAVQFNEAVEGTQDTAQKHLMQSEIARAERASDHLPIQDAADLRSQRRLRRTLISLFALVLISAIYYPRAWMYEIPRFAMFFADNPPFTLTDFRVTPQGAHVRQGANIEIGVTVGGLLPDTVSLVTGQENQRGAAIPLPSSEPQAYKQVLENVTQDTWYYVQANTGRSRRYWITVDREATVTSVLATLRPPAYTHRPAEKVQLTNQPISGLFGAWVDLDITCSRAVNRGLLTLTTYDGVQTTIQLTASATDRTHLRGSLQIHRNGEFTLDLTSTEGLTTVNAYHGKVELKRDDKPIVYIEQPGQNAMVTQNMKAPITVNAEDDMAISRIELHRSINGIGDYVVDCPIPSGRANVAGNFTLDLRDLGVRPGDVIQYYATAYDNNPGKPNLTDSERYWIWVVSPSDYQKALKQQRGLTELAQEYRALTDAAKDIADRQAELAKAIATTSRQIASHPNDPRLAHQLQQLRDQQRQLEAQARKLASEMRAAASHQPQYDIEKRMQQQLAAMAKQMEQAANSMRRAHQSARPSDMASASQQAAQQAAKTAQSSSNIERTLQALEKLQPLYQDVQHLQEIAQQQKRLAQQARELANRAQTDEFTKARLKDLAQQQQECRQALQDTKLNLRRHSDECGAQFPNAAAQAKQLSRALDRSHVEESMQSSETALSKGAIRSGADEAETASNALASLLSQCNACQNAANNGLTGAIGSSGATAGSSPLQQLAKSLGLGASASSGGSGSNGEGEGGTGGSPAPTPGSRPGDSNGNGTSTAKAVVYTQQRASNTSSNHKAKPHQTAGEAAQELGKDNVEALGANVEKPVNASDSASDRYPSEYRKLVKDYFKSVANGK